MRFQKAKMKQKNKNSLKEIVEEIEIFSSNYRTTDDKDEKKTYSQYIELIILDAPKTEQYNLCDYWSRLIR